MSRSMTTILLLVFLLALPLAALADEASFTMRFNSPVTVAGTTLKAGEYRIVVQDQATKATVVFYDGRRELVRAEGTWTSLEAAATRNAVTTRKDEEGRVMVSRILLRGNNKAVQVAEISAKAGK